jgi:hypothetical protein
MKGTPELNELLSLFTAVCGHKWVGPTTGYYECPVCGLYDGKNHLVSMESIRVQVEEYGSPHTWGTLSRLAHEAFLKAEGLTDEELRFWDGSGEYPVQ